MERQVAEQGHQKKEQAIVKSQKQNVPIKEKKEETKETPLQTKDQTSNLTQEKKPETNQEKQTKPVIKKEKATVSGKDLPLSYKTSGAICRFIKNKNPQKAIELLELVIRQKASIPMRGEAAHKKDQKNGYCRGKYPEKTAGYFIKLLKSLIANAKTNNLDAEKIVITLAKADKASNPIRGTTRLSAGRKKFKRAHIFIEVKEKTEKVNPEKNKKTN